MKTLLLTASFIASIALPTLGLAQSRDDHANRDRPAVQRDIRQDVRQDNRTDFKRGRAWAPGDRSWWRGRPEFAGYAGVRTGFWFVPGRGYINPGPRWLGYGWRVGAFVPSALRGYAVVDPYVYGLPPAPYGMRYIYLANNVALIRMGDGHIVRMVPNVY